MGEPEPKQYRTFFRKPKITAILTNHTNFNVKFRTQINYINLLGTTKNETNVEITVDNNLKNKITNENATKEIHLSLNSEKLVQETKKTSFIKNPPINLEKKIMPSTQAICGLKNKSNTHGELIEHKREELKVLLEKYTNIMKKQKKIVRRKDKIDQLDAVDKNESMTLDQYAIKNYAKLNPFKIKLNSKPKARLKMSKSLKYTVIENDYVKTISKDENEVNFKFLIFNKSNKLLVFCSPIGFSILSKSKYWQASGKFHISSKHYFQLYIIYGWFMGRMFPCVYSLMHRIREKDYNLLFKYIY